MWLEGDGDCFRANHRRTAHDFTENMRVRPMHAIEISHGHYCGSETGRNVIEFVEDLHLNLFTAKFAKVRQERRELLCELRVTLCDLCGQKLFSCRLHPEPSVFIESPPRALNLKLQLHPII